MSHHLLSKLGTKKSDRLATIILTNIIDPECNICYVTFTIYDICEEDFLIKHRFYIICMTQL